MNRLTGEHYGCSSRLTGHTLSMAMLKSRTCMSFSTDYVIANCISRSYESRSGHSFHFSESKPSVYSSPNKRLPTGLVTCKCGCTTSLS